MEKCPICGANVELVVTEILCSQCGIVDGSKIALKKAKKLCLRPRLIAGGIIVTIIFMMYTFPFLESLLFWLIFVISIGLQFYTDFLVKRDFPLAQFDNI